MTQIKSVIPMDDLVRGDNKIEISASEVFQLAQK